MGCGALSSWCKTKPKSDIIQKPVTRLPSPITPPPPLPVPRPHRAPSEARLLQPPANIVENCVVVWLDLSNHTDSEKTQEIEEQLQQVASAVIKYTDSKQCFTFIDGVKDEKVFLIVSGTPDKQFISSAQDLSQVDRVYNFCLDQEQITDWSGNYPQVRGPYKSANDLCQQLKKDIKSCDHDMIGFGFIGGSSLNTATESDQNMLDGENAEELSLNTETDDNQSMVDGEATEELSSSIPAKSNPTMVDDKTMEGSSSSSISVKSSVTMVNGKLTEGSSSNISAKSTPTTIDGKNTGGSSSNVLAKSNPSKVNGKTTGGSSSNVLAKSNPTMVDDKTMEGSSSSNIPVKSSVTMVNGKLTEGSSSNISAKSTPTTIDGKTTGRSSSNVLATSNPTIVNGKTMEGSSSSNIPVKSSVTMVNGKRTGGSSSNVLAKSNPSKVNRKTTGGSSSNVLAKNNPTMVNGKTTGELQPNTTTVSGRHQVLFVYDQLFREIVLTLTEEGMGDICKFCRQHYEKNHEEMKFIADLEKNYSMHPPVWWYSKEACLYKMLNKALRTHEYDTLYELRVFIRVLHENIVVQQKKPQCGNVQLVYRGQGFEKADFEYICSHEGELMRFSSFLSTSTNREKALEFARDALGGKRESVLMEIELNKNICVPFAYISKVSFYRKEEEWLFSMGSVFRIGQTQLLDDNDKIWVVKLTAANDNNEHQVAMKEYFKDSLKDENVYLNFARLMHQLAYWKQSKALYLTSLKTEKEWHRQAAIYNNLGLILSELKDYDEALEYYYQSLNLELQHGGSNSKDLASTYNNIGTLYYKLEKMDLAIENFQLAIKVYNDTSNDNQEIMATLYNNIALILNCKGEHKKAMENNERCLNIRINIFPDIDPSLATTYNSIASTYYYQQSYTEAVKFAEKAVEIDNLALPPDHPQTKIHKENLNRFKELASTKS